MRSAALRLAACVAALLLAAGCVARTAGAPDLRHLVVPKGFDISLYVSDVPGARSLALGPQGTLFVSTRSRGNVYAVRDGKTRTIATGLDTPNGVAVKDGALYVAEVSRVLRYDGIEDRLDSPPAPVVVTSEYPKDRHHGWKFIAFGPDGHLYVPVGAPCNNCRRDDPRYASITRMKADGTFVDVFANGVRNTVGFDWHPETKELWFTDNGRDWFGDDTPPDELNRAPKAGLHFGFPFCHGGDLPDSEYGRERPCSDFVKPEQKLGPHVAALGMRFYTGKMFPSEYRNQIFFAEHGSWNRSTKIGYRVSLVKLENGRAVYYEPFAEGWLRNGKVSGRPVDVLVMPDGALLISDDMAGVVYRVAYRK